MNNNIDGMIKPLFSVKRTYILSLFFAFLFLSVQAQDTGKVLYEKAGTASFYNKKFQGRKTSSGEMLDNNRYTAAHPSLPFGTLVRVINMSNGKSVVVKINDRFVKKKNHLVDVTYSAAKEIDMVSKGIVKIELEVLGLNEAEAEAEAIVPLDTISYKLQAKVLYFPVSKPNYEQLAYLK
jgi:rare lipoprotein A